MKKKFEKAILEPVEKVTRKNAYPDDIPRCPYFLHQPKRPKK